MKKTVQALLKRIGLHERLQSSIVYELYWRVADPQLIKLRLAEIDFYRRLLDEMRPGQIVFDVGANMGTKSEIFLKLGARVIAMDPDKSNQELLKRKFYAYRLRKKPIEIVGAAVSDRSGVETMWVQTPGSAFNTLSDKWVDSLHEDADRFGERVEYGEKVEVRTMTLEELMTTYGVPYYIKIDVEGYELQVLRGLKRPVPMVSFEANLPDFQSETFECIALLEKIAPDGLFNFAAACEDGLLLKQWLKAGDFAGAIERCGRPSVEVYWRT